MMKEELEKRLHEFTVQIYEEGFEEGREDAEMDTKTRVEGAYEKGLEDTWECLRKFRNLSEKEREKIFDTIWTQDILCHFKPLEFAQKIKEYEERQKQDEKSCINCLYALNETYSETCRKCVTCEEDHFEPKQTDATDINDGSIKVGDEVINGGVVGVVTHVRDIENGMKAFTLIDKTGKAWNFNDVVAKRTGRNFPQIAEVLEQLRGEEE